MALILPGRAKLRAWTKLVPAEGDLVFARSERDLAAFREQGFMTYTREEALAAAADVWTLDRRAWHGYALAGAAGLALLPTGKIEKLPARRRAEMRKGQMAAGNAAIQKGVWITSALWRAWSREERIEGIRRWYLAQAPRGEYPLYSSSVLSAAVRDRLARADLLSKLNTFADRNGPNCFAFVAAYVNGESNGWENRWLQAKPFTELLKRHGYRRRAGGADEIFLVRRNGALVHAALGSGSDWIVEKPGQSFYEPYRIQSAAKFRADWPSCNITTYAR